VKTADDTTALALAAQAGDAAARERLIEVLLPAIAGIGRAFRVEGLDFADVVQEGAVGVLRALQRYDPQRGVPFEAYAALWIRQSLQELRSDFMRPLRLPPRALRQIARLKSEHRRFWAAEHREPSLTELADKTGIDRDQVETLVRAEQQARLLSEPVGAIEGEVGVLESVAGEQVKELLGRLSEREREVIESRFGFGDRRSEGLVEIGERLGISAERVRQLEERALAKMRVAGAVS
jgi:RNA polymerase sigma factor (sigma-70 family)